MGFFSSGGNQRKEIDIGRRAALNALSPTAIGGYFSGLQGIASPFLNQIAAGVGLQGQAQNNAVLAQMARMGLGGTGIGASLGAGLTAGSAFQGNQVRARIFQDLLQQAMAGQSQVANIFMQSALAKAGTQKSALQNLQPLFQAAALYKLGGGGSKSTPGQGG